jgi:non-ribosomal peptide synthetase component F
MANQDVPFDVVVSDLRPARGLGHNPFFQVLFSFEEDDAPATSFGDARIGEIHGIPTLAAKFDVTFTVRSGADDLSLHVEYATDLFEHATIAAIAADYETSLRALLTDPSTVVAELPLTVRPEHPAAAVTAVTSTVPYVPPATDLEREILAVWSDVLGVTGLGVRDDFFRLGGDSLSASRVIWRVQRRYGVTVSVRALFADPTIAGFAAHVESLAAATPVQPVTPRRRVKLSELVAETRSEV